MYILYSSCIIIVVERIMILINLQMACDHNYHRRLFHNLHNTKVSLIIIITIQAQLDIILLGSLIF